MHRLAECTDVWGLSIILLLKMICYFQGVFTWTIWTICPDLTIFDSHFGFQKILPRNAREFVWGFVWNLRSKLIHHHKMSVSVNVTNSCLASGLPLSLLGVLICSRQDRREMCYRKKYWQISLQGLWQKPKTAGDFSEFHHITTNQQNYGRKSVLMGWRKLIAFYRKGFGVGVNRRSVHFIMVQ